MKVITLPGLIDPHVHLREPGQEEKEDFYTGTCAALAGGFTTVADMPNNKIPITSLEKLNEKISLAKEKVVCNIGFYFGSMGNNLDEFPKVINTVLGLKLFLNETTGNFLIDKDTLSQIFSAWPKEKPILTHAEDRSVADVIENVKRTGKKAHICHVATKDDLQQIIDAKEEGLPISCGVTPHHLFLTEDDISSLGAFGELKPFLSSKQDQEFLWKNLSYIDCVESDHAPHTKEEKKSGNPPYGIPGLETTLPLLLTAVSENRLTIQDITRLCFDGPKTLLHLHSNNDSIEIDLAEEYEIQGDKLFTKCKWTPFEGWKVRGKIKKVVMNGYTAFEDNKILVKSGQGNIIY